MNPWIEAGLRALLLALVAAGGLALWRPANAYLVRGVWRAVLLAALAMPGLLVLLPRLALWEAAAPPSVVVRVPLEMGTAATSNLPSQEPVPWLALVCVGISVALLIRLIAAGVATRRIVTGGTAVAPGVVESPRCRVPFVAHSTVVLPVDWRSWPEEKLSAVLTHERTHIAGRDPLFQLLAQIYRACFWWSPLAWWLPRRLGTLAEEIADDAVLTAEHDRIAYAETLADCFARARGESWSPVGVAMARAGAAAGRIDRILDASRDLARPLGAGRSVALAGCLAPLLWLCAAGTWASAQAPPVAPASPAAPAEAARTGETKRGGARDAFVLVQGNNVHMNGSTEDAERARSLRGRITGDFLWFRRGGSAFVISDAATMKEIEDMLAPQEKLGEQQAALGEQQAKLGEQQAKLGEEQARLGEEQAGLDQELGEKELQPLRQAYERGRETYRESHPDMQAMRARIREAERKVATSQVRIAEEHAKLGEQQGELGRRQAELGEQQAKLGGEQAKLGAEQARLAGLMEKQLRALLDRIVAEGRAKPEEDE